MKKKFDFKLTITLVSLFIGFLLIVLGNKNKYCLGFGLIVLGLSVGFYAYYKAQKINESLKELDQEIAQIDEQDYLAMQEAYVIKRKMKKQKNGFAFYIFAFLLVVCGVVAMF